MSMHVGITGGIGSGKSLVSTIFQQLGVPVYASDQAGRTLLNTDPVVGEAVREAFGEAAYPEGKVDRAFLAEKVFHDPARLAQLNRIIHPAVARDFDRWAAEHAAAPYLLKEAAILIESGAHEALDKLILVVAPAMLRKQRVMARDQVAGEAVEARMANQLSDAEKRPYADFEIHNDEQQLLIPQVLQVHRQLLDAAASKR